MKIGTISKNEYVRIFAKIGDWYVVQTNSDLIGTVNKNYIRNATLTNGTSTNKNTTITDNLSGYSTDEKELLKLINNERKKYGLVELKFDSELQRVAKAKAIDLAENNYFAHNSPTYGTPFEMMKAFKITYNTAGENLAGNSSLSGAVTAWMNSEGHRANILNNTFNYTGIGIVESKTYGKILVQMFIGK